MWGLKQTWWLSSCMWSLFLRKEREGFTCRCRKTVEKIFPRISIMTMSSPGIKIKVYLCVSLQLGRVVGVSGRHQLSLKCMQMWGKVKYNICHFKSLNLMNLFVIILHKWWWCSVLSPFRMCYADLTRFYIISTSDVLNFPVYRQTSTRILLSHLVHSTK